ncbi:AbrB/MazE/SpoVT family DNA-binding domain-containing protein [Prosthecomicrobium pneumaticum]|uniref:Antitoxin MazE n=1 Tax=Prosthecomicrobium pneumaticum TaxID=81895 RepID=A0A7W9L3Y3_9HYPH|nr:AbrB/MazE/SpoVT family DNA-binding domain-containing protein [Prosthecomicrobium pneumaticum]MBB5755004.1 antitoxin MazE [Prosthecomicrobium pneumaticum]
MRVKLAKWGNSLAVRIPKKLAERLDLKEGTELDVDVAGLRGLRMAAVGGAAPKTLDELFAEAERTGPLEPPALVDWGPDRGNERWPDEDWSDIAPTDEEMRSLHANDQRTRSGSR